MARLVEKVYNKAAGLWHFIIVGLVSAFLGAGSAYGVLKNEISSVRDRADWIEKQLSDEAADQKNQISALRGTVNMMREQSMGIEQLRWQINRIQEDIAEIKDAMNLRLRPDRNGR